MKSFEEIINSEEFTAEELARLLDADETEQEALRARAEQVLFDYVGPNVYLRGLVEYSNVCRFDCYYCGIRRSANVSERYTLEPEQVVEAAVWCAKNGLASFVIQSGERRSDKFIDDVCRIVSEIKRNTRSERLPDGLGITLSIGEQSYASYKRLFEAGAHRYLLRIETTNPAIFAAIHPEGQSLEERKEALGYLKEVGYQVGTGVMIGLPGQTSLDLARDIEFFRDTDVDMIGMGPFLIHHDTPMSEYLEEWERRKEDIYRLALKMIATTRLALKDINIASTTALQALKPQGRNEGLRHGANVIMPLFTPLEVRQNYKLYDGKPCLDDNADDAMDKVIKNVASIGRQVGLDLWGDSRHFKKRQTNGH